MWHWTARSTYAANRHESSLQKRGRSSVVSLHDIWTSWPATMCTLCLRVMRFCTLRTRPISSATRGSTRRSRTSPRTDGSPESQLVHIKRSGIEGCCCRGAKNLVIVRGAVSANRDVGD